MNYRILDLKDLDEWRKYYEKLNGVPPYHSPNYLDILETNFESEDEEVKLFLLEDEEGSFIYYPFFVRNLGNSYLGKNIEEGLEEYKDIVSSWYYGGPITSNKNKKSLLKSFNEKFNLFCDRNNVVSEFIRFDPNLKNYGYLSFLSPKFERQTVWVDLRKNKKEIFYDYEKRNRNAIRQAKETDLEIKLTNKKEDWRDFYDIYISAMEAKNASDHYFFEYNFFKELLETDFASLFVPKINKKVVGGSLIVYNENIAHDYLRATDPDFWDMRVNNLLCHEVLMNLKEEGIKVFDFQGGRPGVFKFKKGFSPKKSEFYISNSIHNHEVYDKLLRLGKEIDIDVKKDYFPKYRVKKSN